jgi:ABC-type bacteriocin/lantibiotic exporter with double-glycine peptidase domain
MEKGKVSIYDIATKGIRLWGLSVIVIETIAYTFSFLVSGLVKKDIFNILEGKDTTLGIVSVKILIILNVVIPLLINFVKQINSGMVAKLTVAINKNVKQNLLKNVLGISLDKRIEFNDGEIISLFRSECEDVSSYFLQFYYQVPKIVLCIAVLVVLFYTNPIFALVSLLPTILVLVILRFLNANITNNRKAVRQDTSKVVECMETVMGNIEYFKMAYSKDKVYEIFEDKCNKRRKSEIKDRVLDKILGSLSENSANFTLGIVLLIAIPLYKQGLLTIGEIVMFEYYYAFLTSLPDAVGILVKSYKQTKVSSDRLLKLGINSDNREEDKLFDVLYDNGKLNILREGAEPLTNISDGQIIVIGNEDEEKRSLLLQQLFCLCNVKISNTKCIYVPKEPLLFDTSIKENICMGEIYDENRFFTVLSQTDLLEDIKMFEDGVNKLVGKKGTTVSGGQRKRIAVARALYAEPDIIFFDGLTDQVDSKTENKMISQILKKFSGIIFISSISENIAKCGNYTI